MFSYVMKGHCKKNVPICCVRPTPTTLRSKMTLPRRRIRRRRTRRRGGAGGWRRRSRKEGGRGKKRRRTRAVGTSCDRPGGGSHSSVQRGRPQRAAAAAAEGVWKELRGKESKSFFRGLRFTLGSVVACARGGGGRYTFAKMSAKKVGLAGGVRGGEGFFLQ